MLKNNKAFTLIELLVVITIAGILMFVSYIPFDFYQKKAKIRVSSREISQSFYEAKNMAVSGIKESIADTPNQSVGLYMTIDSADNDKLQFFAYPYDIEESEISLEATLIKTTPLQTWVRMEYLWDYKNLLFYYTAIDWDLIIYTFDGSTKTEVLDDKIHLMFSYMGAVSSSLQGNLVYFKDTNIVDYE